MAGDRIAVGVISRPHGVRGEARVHLYDPTSEALDDRETVLLVRDGVAEERAVAVLRRAHEAYLIKLVGVDDRNAAEALRGAEIAVPRSELPALAPGEFLLADLIGLPAEDTEGRPLGRVASVIHTGAQDLAVLHGDDGERMIPIVPELVVEVSAERVVFDPPDGLPVEPLRKGK